MKSKRVRRKLNGAKEVSVRKLKNGYCLDLPDWKYNGNYHLHIKGRKREELEALRECLTEILGEE